MNQTPDYLSTLQKVTVKVVSKVEAGSGVIYKPSLNSEYVFVLTARHVIFGDEESSGEVQPQDVELQCLWTNDNVSPFKQYKLSVNSHIIYLTDVKEDFAALVIPTIEIEHITGKLPCIYLVKHSYGLRKCIFKGFPEAYLGKEPILMEGEIIEHEKVYPHILELEVNKQLSDQWITRKERTAYENVAGFSGSGIFILNNDEIYLLGIISKFGPFNRFLGNKVILLAALVEKENLPELDFKRLEIRQEVRDAIKKLKNNTQEVVLNRVSDSIGDNWHLSRQDLISRISDNVNISRLTVIYGEAGVGKSAIVKNWINLPENQSLNLIAWKGEQICYNSFQEVLERLGVQTAWDALFSSPILEGHTIIWIDGAEKCVERDEFEALLDILRLTEKYPNLRVIVTIRRYSLEYFRLHILSVIQQFIFIETPLLNEKELEETVQLFPHIRTLFSNNKIRRLLAIPFYLNYAVQLNEIFSEIEPLDEYKFKDKVWNLLIDKNRVRRSEVLMALIVKRAKAMALYVSLERDDLEIIEELIRDQILVREASDASNGFAPAHDIFEDWALIRYVRQVYQNNSQPRKFFQELGTAYALRRGFRFWIQEEVSRDLGSINSFINSCLKINNLEKFWKDELFIAIIQSEKGEDFLKENESLLLKNHACVLIRFIDLFKTACKEPNLVFPNHLLPEERWKIYSTNFKPYGKGWELLIKFIHRHLDKINENRLIYSFLKDWSNKLEWNNSLPEEGRQVGLIAMEIFNRISSRHRNGLYSEENKIREGLLELIFRLTEFNRNEVSKLLENTIVAIKTSKTKKSRLEGKYSLIVEYVLSFFYSRELCRVFPDLIFDIAWEYWIDDSPTTEDHYHGRHDEQYQYFGLVREYKLHDYPSSAYQTPILWLLRFHSIKTLAWVDNFLNFTGLNYVNSKAVNRDEVFAITMTLNNGNEVIQYGNDTIYQMFRGTGTNTPYLLQSVLMALEAWFFECAKMKAEQSKKMLQAAFSYLLNSSKTVSSSSVLISVGMAYPEEVGDYILPLLTVPKFYSWDLHRMTAELHAFAPIGGNKYGLLYQQERIEANRLTHRNQRLEEFVINQSFNNSSFREKIIPILDRFWNEAPKEDTIWRKCLNQMDIRKWHSTEVIDYKGKTGFLVEPKLEDDVKAMIEEYEEERVVESPLMSAQLWAKQAFDKKEGIDINYNDWLQHYQNIRNAEKIELIGYARHVFAPALLASVGIRDFLDELNEDQMEWCENSILTRAKKEINIEANIVNLDLSNLPSPFEGLPSLLSLVLLLRKEHNEKIRPKVIQLLFDAVISVQFSDNIKKVFFDYFREKLWTIDEKVAYACWVGLIEYSKLWQKRSTKYIDYYHIDEAEKKEEEKFNQAKNNIIQSVINLNVSSPKLPSNLKKGAHWWLDKALCILPSDSSNSEFHLFVIEYLELLIKESLFENDETNWHSNSTELFNSYEVFSDAFVRLMYVQPKEIVLPIFDRLIDVITQSKRYNHETFKFIEDCVEKIIWYIIKNNKADASIFGFYWNYLFEKTQAIGNRFFIPILLLKFPWNENIENWEPIQHNKLLFANIIQSLGEYSPADVVRLLGGVGSESLLPEGIIWLNKILKKVGSEKIDVLETERFLHRILISHIRIVRRDQVLLKNLIEILNVMIEKGSSLAFFMRESLFGGLL